MDEGTGVPVPPWIDDDASEATSESRLLQPYVHSPETTRSYGLSCPFCVRAGCSVTCSNGFVPSRANRWLSGWGSALLMMFTPRTGRPMVRVSLS